MELSHSVTSLLASTIKHPFKTRPGGCSQNKLAISHHFVQVLLHSSYDIIMRLKGWAQPGDKPRGVACDVVMEAGPDQVSNLVWILLPDLS